MCVECGCSASQVAKNGCADVPEIVSILHNCQRKRKPLILAVGPFSRYAGNYYDCIFLLYTLRIYSQQHSEMIEYTYAYVWNNQSSTHSYCWGSNLCIIVYKNSPTRRLVLVAWCRRLRLLIPDYTTAWHIVAYLVWLHCSPTQACANMYLLTCRVLYILYICFT